MKIISKKIILFFSEIIILSMYIFSAPLIVWVMPTDGKNLNKTDSLWLPDEVHKKLRENMTNYYGLIVAEENNDELAKTQAKSYNENIREQDIIRMGKQRGANYVVLSSITAIGSAYSVNVLFQELKSGKHLAESNKRASNKDDLYKIPGSAVDEAFIEICEVLNPLFGTGLSPFEKQELRKGKRALSDEENIKYLENEKKKIEEELKKINDELKAIAFSTAMDAEIKRAQLELEKKQEEVKLEVNKQRRQNLLQEEENRKNDLANLKKLSAELQKRENEELEKLRDKVDVAIKRKVDAPRLFEQINQIEAKKNILIKIRNDRITETERIIEEEKSKILKREKEIMEEPLPVTQINSETGDMMPAVRKAKEMEVQQEVEKIQKVYIKHLSNIKKIYLEKEQELLKQIKEANKNLEKVYEADNIADEKVELCVNRYIAEEKAWEATVALVIDEKKLFQKEVYISYKTLFSSEKKIDINSLEYAADIEKYNSYFSKGEKPVTAKITYKISAAPDYKPSLYILHIYSIEFYNTKDETKKQKISINKNLPIQITPVYDIRDKNIKNDDINPFTHELNKQNNVSLTAERKDPNIKIYTINVSDLEKLTWTNFRDAELKFSREECSGFKWFINETLIDYLVRIKDDKGKSIWERTTGTKFGKIDGYEVVESSILPQVADIGVSSPIAFFMNPKQKLNRSIVILKIADK